jgi:hypothetical protein
MIDGIGSLPFSAVTLPPIPEPRISCRDMVIAASRRNYAQDRAIVEKIITDLHAPVEAPPKPKKVEQPAVAKETPKEPYKPKTESSYAKSTVATKPPVRESVPYVKKTTSGESPRDTRERFKPKSEAPKVVQPTAAGLRSILSKIAAEAGEDRSTVVATPPVASSDGVATGAVPTMATTLPPKTSHKDALRSVLGSVLGAESLQHKETVMASLETTTPPIPVTAKVQAELQPQVVPVVATEVSEQRQTASTVSALPSSPDTMAPSTDTPDPKMLKKILADEGKVRSPFI